MPAFENDCPAGPGAGGFIAGGGEMGERTRAFDWSTTPVGPMSSWPQSLKTVVRILLDSRYAMWLGWGPEFTFFYNDAYARMTLGPKHPWALGRPASEVWPEIWDEVGPRAESVVRTGVATWDEGLLLFLERRGFPEETYHTFSYSPVPNDSGGVGGMLCVVTEDTERTIGERRLKTLRELATRATDEAKTASEACLAAARTLASNPHDLPFILLYLLDADGRTARRTGAVGLSNGSRAAPAVVDLTATPAKHSGWPFRPVMESGRAEIVSGLKQRFGALPGNVWPEPPHSAVVLPLRKSRQESLAGFLVAGTSPRVALDDSYLGFLDLVAAQIASAVANARSYEEERKRAEALAELDRAKTTFFSNVSHEFRTPLTLLMGPVEELLAESEIGLSKSQREQLALAHRNALRLQKLVNTLLDFSRIEAGRVQASYEPVDLAAFTADLAGNFRSACERAGLELIVNCPPLTQPIYVDRDMWEKIVLNLVSNAFKYTLSGTIEVSMRQDEKVAKLSVRDTGTGIPAAELPLIFERFRRVLGAKGRTQEGTGIGLALVRELARLHGGDVSAESWPGQGSTFTVTIPFGRAHLRAERIGAARTQASTEVGAAPYVEEALRWLPATDKVRDQNSQPDSGVLVSRSAESERPRILLCDDNADMRDYIERLLSQRYEVTAVSNGLKALDAALERPPDLVLSDVMMSGLDGFGLLQALRADERTATVPFLLLSARAGEEARIEGLAAGADDYLTKPFRARELLARVQAHLSLAKLRHEANQALQRSERFHRIISDLTSDFTFSIRLNETTASSSVEYISPGFTTVTGYTLEELNARGGWPTMVHPDDLPIAAKTIERVFAGQNDEAEMRLIAKDGSFRWIRYASHPVLNGDGRATGFIGAGQDITERKHAEDALREANATLRSFYDTAPVMMGVVEVIDDDILHLTDNAATGRFFGVDPQRLAYRRAGDLGVRPDQLQEWIRHYRESERTGRPVRFEHPHETPDGIRWVSAIVFCIERLPGGRARCSYVAEDITERKRVAEALRRADQQWHDLAEALPNLVWTDLPDGQCDYLSSQWGTYTGIPEHELLGLNWLDRVIHPDDRERTLNCWMTAVADQGIYDLEYRIRGHDGQYRWFKTRGVPIRDERGRIVKWFGTCTDIEDYKRAEEELRKSEERFRQLANAMPQIVWTAGTDGVVDYSNQRWHEFTGFGSGIGNDDWSKIVHPDDLPISSKRWAESVRTGAAFDMEIRLLDRKSGIYRWHLIRTAPARGEKGEVVRWYGTSTDIHEQKQSADAARFLAEASAELAALVDDKSTLQKVADLAVPYFADWAAVDMRNEDGSIQRLAVAHQDKSKIQLAERMYRLYPPRPESRRGIGFVMRTGHAEIVPEISDEMLARSARDEEHLRLMRALGLRSFMCVPLVVSGKTIGSLTFITAESGRRYAPSDLALAIDLAHRAAIAIENARLYEALKSADRKKDEFIAILAHELRNPLAPIANALQVMRLTMVGGPGAQVRDMMTRQVEQMTRLVDDLLDVSRITSGKITLHKERLDISEAIVSALETSRPLIEAAKHHLIVEPPSKRLYVNGDKTRLAQVISNLLTNASKYTPEGGRISLTVEPEQDFVVIRVKDNGLGIPAEMLPRIFDMFTQVDRNVGRSQGGLGIGLTIVRNLVAMHGGKIEARSGGAGHGSEFIISLPLAPDEPNEPTVANGFERESPPADGVPRRILVVDDNIDSAESLGMLLRLKSNDVRIAHDGTTALRVAESFVPEVVLLDIGMPGIDGYEVARRMRQMSALKGAMIIAQTGWGQEHDRRRSTEAGFDHHFTKPIDCAALEKLLARMPRNQPA